MSKWKKLLKKIWNDETKKLLRYAWKPAKITFVLGIGVLFLIFLILVISGNFESFMVSTDLKYNSPIIKWMFAICFIGEVILLIYGISLCLYKYHRPKHKSGKKDDVKKTISSVINE
jgi:uncharacterized BrkB/YihY/UPF0761 family membrane protein